MLNKNFDHLTFRKPSISKPRLSASIETKEHLLLIFEAAAKRKQYLKKNIKSLRKIDTLNIFDKFNFFKNNCNEIFKVL